MPLIPANDFCRTGDIEAVHGFFESRMATVFPASAEATSMHGKCYVCDRPSEFEIQVQTGEVNWRETLRCQGCGLINRWRSCIHLFEVICWPNDQSRVFITEAVTPLYDLVRARYPQTVGSEFSTDVSPGEYLAFGDRRVLIQDVTALSFEDARFDCILSFDVLEHVPDYRKALNEFARVLEPGGHLLLSVPFTFDTATEIRATVKGDGSIEHILSPQYHGDPLSGEGVLCYQVFGMDLLDEMEQAGFRDGAVYCYASREWGYLGANILFVARRN